MNLRSISITAAFVASTVALAANYQFHVSILGPQFIYTTFDTDETGAFEAANRASQLIQYRTPGAIVNGVLKDYVYIIYADGKIGKFKMVSPQTPTVRLRFEGLVDSVPSDARQHQVIGFVGDLNVYDRLDYINGQALNVVWQRHFIDQSYWIDTQYMFGGGVPCHRGECNNPIEQ